MRKILTFLCLVMLALVALRSLIFYIPWWTWPETAYYAVAETIPRWVKPLVWLLAVGAAVGLVVNEAFRLARKNFVYFPSKDGSESGVERSVIVKIVRDSVADLPGVENPKVDVRSANRGLRVKVSIAPKEVQSLPELTESISRRVDRNLRHVLGIERIDKISVLFLEGVSFELSDVPKDTADEFPLPPPKTALPLEPVEDGDEEPLSFSAPVEADGLQDESDDGEEDK